MDSVLKTTNQPTTTGAGDMIQPPVSVLYICLPSLKNPWRVGRESAPANCHLTLYMHTLLKKKERKEVRGAAT